MDYRNTLLTPDKIKTFVDHPNKHGNAAEIGVGKGGMLRILGELFDGEIWGFDTFTGLPKEGSDGEVHNPGEFASSKDEVQNEAPNAVLIEGVFPTNIKDVTLSEFIAVHIDVDYYVWTLAALEAIWGHVLPGGMVVVDDYGWMNCPGVKRACEDFGKPFTVTGYQAIFIK